MARGKLILLSVVTGLLVVTLAGHGLSQEGGEQPKGGGEDQGGGEMERAVGDIIRNWPTPEEMQDRIAEWRKRAEERQRKQLGATEEEWQVLKPRIDKVRSLQRRNMRGGFRGMLSGWFGRGRGRGRRGGGDGGQDRPQRPQRELTPVERAKDTLKKLLDDETSKAVSLKSALEDLRKAKEKEAQELDTAQKELREVCTLRQEGRLVLMGILD